MADSYDLLGKTALVTGAAQGLGAAIAELMLERGAKVVFADLNEAATERAESGGENALFVQLDVTKEDQWLGAMGTILNRFGGLDILVNNAGAFVPATIQETTVEMLELMFRVNHLGTMLGMKSAVDALSKSTGGSIINISSCVGMRGTVGQSAYASTKWAVRGLTKCAALEFAPLGIRANSVHPGPSETNMMDGWSKEQSDAIRGMIPLGRFGKPIEIAEAVAFLASDAAAYISGAELSVDGAVFA